MDFNNIKSRLERTLASLNARFDNDVKSNTNVQLIQTDIGTGTRTSFGKMDENSIINTIMIILHNLANVKDNLIKSLIAKGKTEQQAKIIVESEINNSIHLQVLIDLINQEKHGYPLTRHIRSHKNPIIKNPVQGLGLGAGKTDSSTEINLTQNGHIISHGNNPKIVINAVIFDDQGNILFDLNTLIDTCYSKWETLAKKYNCI